MRLTRLEAVGLYALKPVWEDGHETKVSYLSTAAVVGRHGLDRQLARALGNIEAITGAVIDR